MQPLPSLPVRTTALLAASGCEVALDDLTRRLYATDASHYEVMPRAVAFPRSARQAAAVIRAAADAGLAVHPRGAGSGLVGGALGEGMVVDFARHNRTIHKFDANHPFVTVGAGVVLDQLNAFLQPRGLVFGPDVATSSRATLGGMIANNSSGARTPLHGVTADHLISLTAIMADGTIVEMGTQPNGPSALRRAMTELMARHHREIAARLPLELNKRRPGYGLDRFTFRRAALTELIAGSEGTLAGIWSAQLQAVPLPKEAGLGLLFFGSVADAMQATVELLDLAPAAIEHVDRILLDQTRGQRPFQAARDLLELDTRPTEALLIVEFQTEVRAKLAALSARRLGQRTKLLTDVGEMNLVWSLRKAGLSLLTGCPGRAKPVTCIEDVAVPPARLPEYYAGLCAILRPLGVDACFYGHAAAGLLHVRPVLDLQAPGDLRKFRQITAEVSALVRQFKGSFAAEHGVGIARTEFLEEQVGPELLGLMRHVKRAFDPQNILNPGKIIGDGRWKLDRDLRTAVADDAALPFTPALAFAAKDDSFTGNLAQCNGCGGCLKSAPTMCPTFAATGDEAMSTRGRANLIRAALADRGADEFDPLRNAELELALDNCLACKACTTECPSNVNLSLLKAELLHARHRRDGLGWREWLVSHVDWLSRLGTAAPRFANAAQNWRFTRRLLGEVAGFSTERMLPAFAAERFDVWFHSRTGTRTMDAGSGGGHHRGRVLLWDDTFVRYHEPEIGMAAVAVLEAAGYEVELLRGRKCCGRPAFSQGHLDEAARVGRHNLALLPASAAALPIVFLEPSCWSMFAEDYRELRLDGAEAVGARSFLLEEFLEGLLVREPDALCFRHREQQVAIHGHCHAKALAEPALPARLARRLPGRAVRLLDTGCCGMAGAFGMLAGKQELSRQVASPLVAQLDALPAEAIVVANGASCRQQIRELTPRQPQHLAQVLADALRTQPQAD
jgi:FAD/FMN-containing dehydrogenase/Fe-S oxidoreductase